MADAFSASWTIIFLFWINGAGNAKADLSRVHCETGWERYNFTDCIWLSETATTYTLAEKTCTEKGGLLLVLRDRRKELFVNALPGRSGEEFWIGLFTTSSNYNPRLKWQLRNERTVDLSYSNFEGSRKRSNQCGFLGDNDNTWLTTSYCDIEKTFICEKSSECKDGWYGHSCDEPCHCQEEHCPRYLEKCSYGCEIGWHGDKCDMPLVPAEVAFYCFNSEVWGQSMLLRVNPRGISYDAIDATDQHGVSMDGCDKASFTFDDATGVYSRVVNITDDDSNRCGGVVTEEGVWQWAFRFQEHTGVLSLADLNVVVKCDFSKADTLSSDGDIGIEGKVDTVVKNLDETKEEVKLSVISPATLEEVQKIQLGGYVALKLELHTKSGFVARGVSGYNCEAYTSDGTNSRLLIDKNGCTAPNSSVSPMKGEDSLITNPFPIFTFPGYASISFRCQYEYCFKTQLMCSNRCKYSRRFTFGYRKKRSEDDAGPRVRKPVFTTVTVLQREAQGRSVSSLEVQPSDDTNRGFPLLYLNPITCSLFLFLLTVFLMLHVFFVRSLKKTVDNMKVELTSHNRSQRLPLL
ncbi:uncharacterized protein [Haliotis cracherodii]|uniref:uncharacterized protein n=1 Tax=Haliotis cracherodii TaxID=6455 RepID=UPI0039E9CD84